MSPILIHKILYSFFIVLVIHILAYVLKKIAKNTQTKLGIRKSRYFALRRLLTILALGVSFLALILIWDVNVKHAWVALTGIMAMVAIAFFAIWSLVGNILAGVLIYFTSPFKLDDIIEVMPDGVKGTVLAVNTFYTLLIDDDGSYINIPNSLFFQKYIRVMRPPKSHPALSQEKHLEKKGDFMALPQRDSSVTAAAGLATGSDGSFTGC